MRRFLGDLGAVAAILGLTVVGYHGGKKQWATLQALQALGSQGHAVGALGGYTLRVYGPPDYHDRLRRYFEQQGQMTIPKLSAVPTATVEDTDNRDHRARGRCLMAIGGWQSISKPRGISSV